MAAGVSETFSAGAALSAVAGSWGGQSPAVVEPLRCGHLPDWAPSPPPGAVLLPTHQVSRQRPAGSTIGLLATALLSRSQMRLRKRRCQVHARASAASTAGGLDPRGAGGVGYTSVLVVGGSGRVGGSTARWLQRLAVEENLGSLRLAVGGRTLGRHKELQERWSMLAPGFPVPEFVQVDLMSSDSVRDIMAAGWDLIVHTAGPFQGVMKPKLLEAAIEAGVPYVDVCDDTELCRIAKELSLKAEKAGVPCIVSAGIWPGVSALMVTEALERLGGGADTVELSFFTAGTGGAGPTIVSATFLLLAEPPLVYEGGREKRAEAWGERRLVDFGPGVGERYVHLLDEPEVYTLHRTLGVPCIRSRFGTAPDIWNVLFAAVKLLPASVLRNRELMQAVALFSMPIIGAVDQLVGSANAMRVDATAADGRTVRLRVTHRDLEDCVGLATAAFALEVLQGRVPKGVWFPAEMRDNRAAIFSRVKRDTLVWEM